MIEYPSIINSSKAPRKSCVAFDKIDGSNLRFKYTLKQGFALFGSRTQLIDESHPHLGQGVTLFKKQYLNPLTDFLKSHKDYRNFREVIVFAEFWGQNSFAGIHIPTDEKFLDFFDVLLGHKDRKFVSPKQFLKDFRDDVGLPVPSVVYEGNLNDAFVKMVRDDQLDYKLHEGVVCKGNESSGAARGGVWMCKIKTQKYLDKLKAKGFDLEKFGE